tara:strand:+ start:226 stop:522 length:297 start_codon:yes stop_codon:yes gene_type:complete
MKKRHNKNQKIEDVLLSFVKDNKLEKGLNNVRVGAAWREIMGNGVQNYTTNIRLQNKTLYVYLSSSVLREELSYGKDKIINLINEELGDEVIKKIILK